MRSLFSILALAAAFALPGAAEAGCMAVGYGGTVVDSRCTYVATDETDWVFGTGPIPAENRWFISVRRDGQDVVLAEGNGPFTDQPFPVHPMVGETVIVEMETFTNGPFGFISVGEHDELIGSLP